MTFGFMFWDLTFFSVFTLALTIFLIVNRKKIGREGPIFLYRTKIGLKVIDWISKKFEKPLKLMSYVIIGLGYVFMAIMIYLLIKLVLVFMRPEYVQAIKIPPLMPFIPYLPQMFKIDWLPPLYFTYWIVITAVIAFVHEGFHGIYARLYNIKIKSTGFGFLGPIPTFFVEPDEKQIQKSKKFNQLAILSAGVFGNMLAALIFFLILILFFTLAYAPAGASFNTYAYSSIPITVLANATIYSGLNLQLDGINMTEISLDDRHYFVWTTHIQNFKNYTEGYIYAYQDYPAIHAKLQGAISKVNSISVVNHEGLKLQLDKLIPGATVSIETKNKTGSQNYTLKLGADYSNESRAVLGIGVLRPEVSGIKGAVYKIMTLFKNPAIYYEPKFNFALAEFLYYLIWWIVLVNIGTALFNILPVAIADGGRFWYLTIWAITKSEKIARRAFKISSGIILAVFLFLMVLWAIGIV